MHSRAALALLLMSALPADATELTYQFYDIGQPQLTDIWVDPAAGDDSRSGASRAEALRSVTAAWQRIPQATPLTTGYRIRLAAGSYPEEAVPRYFESRWGSFEHPVLLEAADGPGSARLPALNIYDARYFYVIGLRLDSAGDDIFHCERCDHVLLRRSTLVGQPRGTGLVQEGVKVNQSQHIYIEESDISGAYDNGLDFVGVQYGHLLRNRIHHADQWCAYVKGGSAYLTVAGNELYDCFEGGFTAGQGTSFEYMVAPWLHYEAYDIKFVNNLVHDVEGAGMGVNGGYNILLAHNTLYRVGSRSHGIEVVFGLRICGGHTGECSERLAQGGWGTITGDEEPIPNRNVFIYNNLLYNPAGFASPWQHFTIHAPRTPGAGSAIPGPAVTDANLRIRGNLIWNGPAGLPLGIEEGGGCQGGNPTCNAAQLRADNLINQIEPQLTNPAAGDFRPQSGGNLFSVTTYTPPDFDWSDSPAPPAVPAGRPANGVTFDRNGSLRAGGTPPGAFTVTAESEFDRVLNWAEQQYGDLLRPGGGGSATTLGYYYRHYSGTGAYVGIKDGRAWYLGPASGGEILEVGPYADYLRQAAEAGW